MEERDERSGRNGLEHGRSGRRKIKRKGWGVRTGEVRGEGQEEKCENGRNERRK